MKKTEISEYVQKTIESKVFSKLALHTGEIEYYFKNRHTGLAGLENEQVVGLCYYAIRNLRVWREIELRTKL